MQHVTVAFKNGNMVTFDAEEFDANFTEHGSILNKYPYKDGQGQDSFIHLKPNEVAGVFLTKAARISNSPIEYTVSNGQ